MRGRARVGAPRIIAVKCNSCSSVALHQDGAQMNLPVDGQIVFIPNDEQHLVVRQVGAHIAFDLCRVVDQNAQNVAICKKKRK